MKLLETMLAPGGLMRCCTGTFGAQDFEREVTDGEVLPCDHCSSSMILDNGTWRWNREAAGL